MVLAGAGCSASPQPSPVPAEPVATIRIANIGEYSILNLIAREKGFFVRNGLDARITEYDSGATSIGALLAGEADVAVAADFVGVRRMFAEPDVRILARVSDHDVFRLIARRDRGILRPGDLKGKKIGATLGTAGEQFLHRFLAAGRVPLPDATVLDRTPAEMAAQIETGELDAVLIFYPHAFAIEQKMGDVVASWSAQGDQWTSAVLYSTRTFVEAHPETAIRYLRSLQDALQYLQSHDAEARRILADAMGYAPAYVDAIWPRFRFQLTLNQDLIATLEDQAHWLVERGLAGSDRIPNYLDAIWFPGLERVAPEAATIVH